MFPFPAPQDRPASRSDPAGQAASAPPPAPLCLGRRGGADSLTKHGQAAPGSSRQLPRSSAHLTRPPPALGRACEPGSCRGFRPGPPGLTLSATFSSGLSRPSLRALGSVSGARSICHGKGEGHSREQVAWVASSPDRHKPLGCALGRPECGGGGGEKWPLTPGRAFHRCRKTGPGRAPCSGSSRPAGPGTLPAAPGTF